MSWPFRSHDSKESEGVAAVDRIIEHVDHIGRAVEQLRLLVEQMRREADA